jgi:ribonuclease J
MKKDTLRIIPLGGLGEVGRNTMLYEYNEQILIVDCGIMFPGNDMWGIDYIIADLSYLEENAHRVVGIIATHGHEDHIGAMHHLLEVVQAPIYATSLTLGLLEVKLARNKRELVNRQIVRAGEKHRIGPFEVEFFHMSHSIPDGVGLGITTPAGLVIHSGDFKFDHTPVDNWPSDFAKLAEFSSRGVLALMADSTNAEQKGWTSSERVIDAAFEKIFNEAPGRIIIASFASLVSRVQQVATATARHQRKIAFVGTSMVDNVKITRKLGYLDIDDSLVVPIEQTLGMKKEKVVIMCTGAQGEPTSIMGRLSTGSYRLFDIQEGDTVVLSSQAIPGNEENVSRTINRLFQRGANVVYEGIAPVHVSGHASQEEIKLLLSLVKPEFYIPIHGEPRHLISSARLANEVGIPEENIQVVQNGQSIEFHRGQMSLGKQVPASYVFVDGSSVGDVGPDVMREREILGRDGMVVVNLVIKEKDKQLVSDPVVTSFGFTAPEEAASIMNRAGERVAQVLANNGNGDLKKVTEKTIRNFLYDETRRRPRVFVTTSTV